jgi:hypothetical protein
MMMGQLELIWLHLCITDLLLFLLVGKGVEMEAFYSQGHPLPLMSHCHCIRGLVLGCASSPMHDHDPGLVLQYEAIEYHVNYVFQRNHSYRNEPIPKSNFGGNCLA